MMTGSDRNSCLIAAGDDGDKGRAFRGLILSEYEILQTEII